MSLAVRSMSIWNFFAKDTTAIQKKEESAQRNEIAVLQDAWDSIARAKEKISRGENVNSELEEYQRAMSNALMYGTVVEKRAQQLEAALKAPISTTQKKILRSVKRYNTEIHELMTDARNATTAKDISSRLFLIGANTGKMISDLKELLKLEETTGQDKSLAA